MVIFETMLQGFSRLSSRNPFQSSSIPSSLSPEEGYSIVAETSAFDDDFEKDFGLELKNFVLNLYNTSDAQGTA